MKGRNTLAYLGEESKRKRGKKFYNIDSKVLVLSAAKKGKRERIYKQNKRLI